MTSWEGGLYPACKWSTWYEKDLPGEGEDCCCISQFHATRKDAHSKGVNPKTFRFRAKIEKNSCIRSVEYVWRTCWREEVPTPPGTTSWISEAICDSWMKIAYDLKMKWPVGMVMRSGFLIKWQECVPTSGGHGKWETQRDELGGYHRRLPPWGKWW